MPFTPYPAGQSGADFAHCGNMSESEDGARKTLSELDLNGLTKSAAIKAEPKINEMIISRMSPSKKRRSEKRKSER